MAAAEFSKFAGILTIIFFSSPIWMPFISLSCPIALCAISSTMLNKMVRGHPFLFHDLVGKGVNFSVLSMMLAIIT